MCKVGDIIIIYDAKDNNRRVGPHPFLVLDDSEGIVRGTYHFDFIGGLLSSNENGQKDEKLHKFDTNFPIVKEDKIYEEPDPNNKDSFIALNPLFYFDKTQIRYKVLCRLDEDIFELLMEYIEELNDKGHVFRQCIDNAKPITESEDS